MKKESDIIEKKEWYIFFKENQGHPLNPSSPEWSNIIDKILSARDSKTLSPCPDWHQAMIKGIVSDRTGYLSLIRDVSIGLVARDLAYRCDKDEMTLIHLVRILDETDRSLSRLSEKIEDYYIALHPAELALYERNVRSLIDIIAKTPEHPLNDLAKSLHRFHDSRVIIAQNVQIFAEKTLPNMSKLCGPLVAARLLAKAGSKQNLAFMPSSSLQVFGAGPSLFTHLTTGTNPPKHGIIYQYKGIHNAKRRFRGRVSRVLACQLAIAAKIDYHRGFIDDNFIKKANERIYRAGL